MTDENTGRYCKCCRWFYRMEDGVGKCTEAHWCSIDYIRDYRTVMQSCTRWMPKTGLSVSTGTN